MRGMICKDDVDILSCAKKLFLNNAGNAKDKYSFQLPIQSAAHQCDVPFRWNPDNESKKPLGDNPTACLSCILFPLNDNTVRWLCSTPANPIPSMREALESSFMLDFFDTKDPFRKYGQSIIQLATERRNFNSAPQNIENARKEAMKAKEQQKKWDEEAKMKAERQRSLVTQQQAEEAKRQADITAAFIDRMKSGGLKGRRKQSRRKRMQSKRKQVKRKQSRRRS